MHVAELSAQDASRYRSLMLHAYEHAADAFTSTAEERAAEPESWWLERIGGPHGRKVAFGAFDGSELVGTVALEYSHKPKTLHRALVIGMYVLPGSRSSGVGRALLDAACRHALARPGMRTMVLTVTEGNAPAIALYRSFGFQPVGTEPMAILTPSGYKAKLHMWKNLRA
jgi:ribosomal protein S18 acetylase RimI-like enzyme